MVRIRKRGARAEGTSVRADPPLDVARVEWLPLSPSSVLVRVVATRRGQAAVTPPQEARLVVREGSERHVFAADRSLCATTEDGGWEAAFPVDIELRPRLSGELALDLRGRELALPPAAPGATEDPADTEPPPDAQIIDRAVLAERRARRAEMHEQTLMAELAAAQASARTLEGQLANTEERLQQNARERTGLETALARQETQLRLSRQREYAEQQLRVEAVERAQAIERDGAAEVETLRRELTRSERDLVALGDDLDRARREAAEVSHTAVSTQAHLRREREQLAARRSELEQHRAQLDGAATERELRVEALEQELGRARDRLAAEHDERVAAEEQLAATSRRLGDRDPAEVANELERREHEQRWLRAELSRLRDDLAGAQASAREYRERAHAAESEREALAGTNELLRADRAAEIARLGSELERANANVAQERARVQTAADATADAAAVAARLRDALALAQAASDEQRARAELAEAAREELAAAGGRLRDAFAQSQKVADEQRSRAELADAQRDELAGGVDQLHTQLQTLGARSEAAAAEAQRLRGELDQAVDALADKDRALDVAQRSAFAATAQGERAAARLAEVSRIARELMGTSAELRAAFDDELGLLRADLEHEREAIAQEREAFERERERHMRTEYAMDARVDELRRQLADSRRLLQATQPAPPEGEEVPPSPLPAAAPPAPAPPAPAPPAPAPPTAEEVATTELAEREAALRRAEMAAALAAAVTRLRARVAPPPEPEVEASDDQPVEVAADEEPTEVPVLDEPVTALPEQPTEQVTAVHEPADSPGAAAEFTPRVYAPDARKPTPWLARAIRSVAARRDPRLAADFILEMLPAQGLVTNRPARYGLTIDEGGSYTVTLTGTGPAVACPPGRAGRRAARLHAARHGRRLRRVRGRRRGAAQGAVDQRPAPAREAPGQGPPRPARPRRHGTRRPARLARPAARRARRGDRARLGRGRALHDRLVDPRRAARDALHQRGRRRAGRRRAPVAGRASRLHGAPARVELPAHDRRRAARRRREGARVGLHRGAPAVPRLV